MAQYCAVRTNSLETSENFEIGIFYRHLSFVLGSQNTVESTWICFSIFRVRFLSYTSRCVA